MWPLFEPIRTLEILKLCEISWDLLKKYFHLKSNAVYNSSAKNYKCPEGECQIKVNPALLLIPTPSLIDIPIV